MDHLDQQKILHENQHGFRTQRSCELVGCFGFNGPLRQYFGLYRTVSQRERERERKRRERIDEGKNVQITPPASTASTIGPCPTVIQIAGRHGTGSLSSTISPPDHPRSCESQLLLTTDNITDMGIMDFAKAFDKVSHQRL